MAITSRKINSICRYLSLETLNAFFQNYFFQTGSHDFQETRRRILIIFFFNVWKCTRYRLKDDFSLIVYNKCLMNYKR